MRVKRLSAACSLVPKVAHGVQQTTAEHGVALARCSADHPPALTNIYPHAAQAVQGAKLLPSQLQTLPLHVDSGDLDALASLPPAATSISAKRAFSVPLGVVDALPGQQRGPLALPAPSTPRLQLQKAAASPLQTTESPVQLEEEAQPDSPFSAAAKAADEMITSLLPPAAQAKPPVVVPRLPSLELLSSPPLASSLGSKKTVQIVPRLPAFERPPVSPWPSPRPPPPPPLSSRRPPPSPNAPTGSRSLPAGGGDKTLPSPRPSPRPPPPPPKTPRAPPPSPRPPPLPKAKAGALLKRAGPAKSLPTADAAGHFPTEPGLAGGASQSGGPHYFRWPPIEVINGPCLTVSLRDVFPCISSCWDRFGPADVVNITAALVRVFARPKSTALRVSRRGAFGHAVLRGFWSATTRVRAAAPMRVAVNYGSTEPTPSQR